VLGLLLPPLSLVPCLQALLLLLLARRATLPLSYCYKSTAGQAGVQLSQQPPVPGGNRCCCC
jgi:hypothetical protein